MEFDITGFFIGILIWQLFTTLVVLIRFSRAGRTVPWSELPGLILTAPFLFWAMAFAVLRKR